MQRRAVSVPRHARRATEGRIDQAVLFSFSLRALPLAWYQCSRQSNAFGWIGEQLIGEQFLLWNVHCVWQISHSEYTHLRRKEEEMQINEVCTSTRILKLAWGCGFKSGVKRLYPVFPAAAESGGWVWYFVAVKVRRPIAWVLRFSELSTAISRRREVYARRRAANRIIESCYSCRQSRRGCVCCFAHSITLRAAFLSITNAMKPLHAAMYNSPQLGRNPADSERP